MIDRSDLFSRSDAAMRGYNDFEHALKKRRSDRLMIRPSQVITLY
jgi:hypothetical protein